MTRAFYEQFRICDCRDSNRERVILSQEESRERRGTVNRSAHHEREERLGARPQPGVRY